MKKTLILAAILVPALSLTACGSISLIFDSSAGDSSSMVSTTDSSTSENSTISNSNAPWGDDHGTELPDNFDLGSYITDFDNAALMRCSYINDILIPQADESAVAKAVEAYKSSEAYSEAIELANKMFRFENGELVENEAADAPVWLKYGYRDYIIQSETSGIAFRYDIVSSVKYTLDGENEESIVLLMVPLPLSKTDSSAHAGFHIPVYVNANGEAHILYDACRQDYGLFKLIAYMDGTVHALFGFGHNEGGQLGAVYSFKNGTPKLELSGCPISLYQGMLMGGFGWNTFEPFMLDGESGEFCALKAVPPGEELAEIICSDLIIQTYLPNAWEMYKNNQIQIIGGKYVTFNTGMPWNDYTFVFNSVDKCFERVEPVSVTGSALPEQITKSYNVKL